MPDLRRAGISGFAPTHLIWSTAGQGQGVRSTSFAGLPVQHPPIQAVKEEAMSELNKSIVKRVPEEITSQGKFELIDEIFAPNFVDHTYVPAFGLSPGREGIRQFITMLRTGFPDIDIKVQDSFAEGDKVVVRNLSKGTHTGEFMGMAPTGKEATWTEIHIVRFEGGQIAEHWANVDQLGIMRQLGALPTE